MTQKLSLQRDLVVPLYLPRNENAICHRLILKAIHVLMQSTRVQILLIHLCIGHVTQPIVTIAMAQRTACWRYSKKKYRITPIVYEQCFATLAVHSSVVPNLVSVQIYAPIRSHTVCFRWVH